MNLEQLLQQRGIQSSSSGSNSGGGLDALLTSRGITPVAQRKRRTGTTKTKTKTTTTTKKREPFKFDNTQIMNRLTAKPKTQPKVYDPIGKKLVATAKEKGGKNYVPKPSTISTYKPTFVEKVRRQISRQEKQLMGGVFSVTGQTRVMSSSVFEELLKQKSGINEIRHKFDQAIYKALPDAFEPLRNKNKEYYEARQKLTEKGLEKPKEKSKEIRETGLKIQEKERKFIQSRVEEADTKKQQILDAIVFNFPQIAVSMGATILTAIATRNPTATMAVGGSTGFGLGANEVYVEGRENGLSDDEAMELARWGGYLIGGLEMLGIGGITAPLVSKTVGKVYANSIATKLVATFMTTGWEGAMEYSQEVVGNWIAKTNYDPERSLTEGADIAGIVGLFYGGAGNVLVLTNTDKADVKKKTPSTKEEDTIDPDDEDSSGADKVNEKVNENLKEIYDKPVEQRTANEQAVVDALSEQYVTPNDAMQVVVSKGFQNTASGRKIIKLVPQAKKEDKIIKINFTEKGDVKNAELVDDVPIPQTIDELAPAEIEELGDITQVYRGAKDQTIDVTRPNGITGGVSFSLDAKVAKRFADKEKGDVKPYTIASDARVVNHSVLEKMGKEERQKYLKDNKVDVVRFDVPKGVQGEAELRVLNDRVLKEGKKPKKKKPTKIEQQIAEYVDSKKTKFRNEAGDEVLDVKPNNRITTKFLEHPDIKNKKVASYAYLQQMLNAGSMQLKQSERELTSNVLETQFKNNKKIVMQDFRKAVIGEMLSIDVIESTSWANYGMDNINLDQDSEKTYILNTDFKHGKTGHFSGDFTLTLKPKDVEIKEIPVSEQNPRQKYAVIKKGVTLTRENIEDNVFTMTPTKKEAQSWIDGHTVGDNEVSIDVKSGLFSHFRAGDVDDTAYIVEVQSDPFQDDIDKLGSTSEIVSVKNRIKNTKLNIKDSETTIEEHKKKIEFSKKLKEVATDGKDVKPEDLKKFNDEYNKLFRQYMDVELELETFYFANDIFVRSGFLNDMNGKIKTYTEGVKEMEANIRNAEAELRSLEQELEDKTKAPLSQETVWKSYKGIWQERTVREAINIKANEGYKKIRFPTPRTVAVIEGYSSGENGEIMPYEIVTGDSEQLEVGDIIDYGGVEYTVLEADQYGITVAESETTNSFDADTARDEDINSRWEELVYDFENNTTDTWGEIKTPEQAQNLLGKIENLNKLIAFNHKADHLETRKKEYIEDDRRKRLKVMKKDNEDIIAKDKKLIELIEKDLLRKENITEDNLEQEMSDGGRDFEENIKEKYGLYTRQINMIRLSLETNALNIDQIPTDRIIEKAKIDIKSREDDVITNNGALQQIEDEYKRDIQEIKDRKKPTDKQLADIPKNLIEQYKGYNGRYYLGQDDGYINWLAERTNEETYTLEDYEQGWRDSEYENYDADFEGIYGEGHVFYDGDTVWTTENDTERFSQPDEYDQASSIEDFSIDNYDNEQKTVLQFYDRQLNRYLQKYRKGNLELVEDDRGYQWWETEVTEEDKGAVTSYRLEDKMEEAGMPITPEQAKKINDLNIKIFGDSNIQITGQILSNYKAMGAYNNRMIRIVSGKGDPEATFYHEAVHKYLDVILTRAEHIELLKTAQNRYKIDDIAQVEERLAEDLIAYANKQKTVKGKLQQFFDLILKRLDAYSKNGDKIEKLYSDILSGKAVEKTTTPAGTKKPSKVALSVTGKAVENALIEKTQNVAGFETITIKDQANKVSNLIDTDLNKARRIIRGEEQLPSDLRGGMLIKGMEEYALQKNNVDILKELAVSPIVAETSIHAQELRTLAERDPYSPAIIMRNIVVAKEKAFQKRYKNKTPKQVKKDEVKKIKKQVKAPSKGDWGAFLKEIEC